MTQNSHFFVHVERARVWVFLAKVGHPDEGSEEEKAT